MLFIPACSATVATLGSFPILSSPILAKTLISFKQGSIKAKVVLITSASPDDNELQSSMSNADSSANLTAVTLYEIDGEYTYIELDAGDEFIPNGDPLMIDDLHTDAIDDAEDLNIIGVRMSMSYTEAEDANGAGCV